MVVLCGLWHVPLACWLGKMICWDIHGDRAWAATEEDGGVNRVSLQQHHPAIQLRILRRLINDVRIRAEPLESIVDGALNRGGSWILGMARLVQRGDILFVENE